MEHGTAERGARRDLALAGAVEAADGALSVGHQRQPLWSGCIYGNLLASAGIKVTSYNIMT